MRKALICTICLASISLLMARDFWEKKPYREWNRRECMKLLQDSPWVQVETRSSFNFSGSGLSTPGIGPSGRPRRSVTGEERIGDYQVSTQYYIRFQSARPVRMAMAQLQLLAERVSEEQARQYVETPPGQGKIVIMIATPPGQDRSEFDLLTTDQVRIHTYLVGKKSRKKIYVERYYAPGEIGGLEPVLVFPRFDEEDHELLPLREEEIRFVSDIGGGINRKFKLKKMVFEGKLEM